MGLNSPTLHCPLALVRFITHTQIRSYFGGIVDSNKMPALKNISCDNKCTRVHCNFIFTFITSVVFSDFHMRKLQDFKYVVKSNKKTKWNPVASIKFGNTNCVTWLNSRIDFTLIKSSKNRATEPSKNVVKIFREQWSFEKLATYARLRIRCLQKNLWFWNVALLTSLMILTVSPWG